MPRYARARYARGRYAGPAGLGTTPPVSPPNLLAAIHARFDAETALSDLLPGGLWTGVAPDDAPYPFASIVEIASARTDRNTSGYFSRNTVFQVTFFDDADDAETDLKAVVEAWEDVFRPGMTPRLAFARGYVTRCECSDDHLEGADDQAEAGRRLRQQILEMRCLTARLPRT